MQRVRQAVPRTREGVDVKRRLLIAAVFLLAGAVLNVAVAWECATRSPVGGTLSIPIPMVPEPGHVVVDRVWHGFGVTITVEHSLAVMYHIDLNVTSGWPLSGFIEDSWQHYQVALDAQTADFMRSTDSVAGETLSDEEMARFGTSSEYGLPSDEYARRFYETIASLPYVKGRDNLATIGARKTNEGVFILELDRVLRNATNQIYATRRCTSFRRLLWPGFAINTLFYAAILWLLILGPFTARRMIRRKRGQCSKCGYDLRGAEHEVCPECGADGSR